MIRPGLVLCLVLLFAAMGCARQYIMLDRVLVLNRADYAITDVVVSHEPTRKFGTVNAIQPQESLDIGISSQPMLAERATIFWTDNEGYRRVQGVKLPYDSDLAKTKKPMILVYVIKKSGRVTAHLQTPSDEGFPSQGKEK